MSGTRRKAIGSWEVALRLGILARRRRRGWPAATAPARRVRSFLVKKEPAPAAHLLHLLDVRPRTLDEARDEVARYDELDHPALPSIVEMFFYKRQLAVVVERDDGVRLDKLKGYLDRDRERLPDAAVWFVGWRLCSALAQAHLARDRKGDLAPILHGTLSLRDVLVEWDGDVNVHGLCPLLSAAPIAEGDEVSPPSRAWIGPGFRNDEPLTPRADTYAAALVLRCLLTGRPAPTPGASVEPMIELRPDIPADVAGSIDRALQGRARPSAAELAQRLEGLVRITDGRRALLDCLELYQALWGLWSVASPRIWSPESPQLSDEPSAGFEAESAVLSSLAAGEQGEDDGEIGDELTFGEFAEPPLETSRSLGADSALPETAPEASVAVASAPAASEVDGGASDEPTENVSLSSTMASVSDAPPVLPRTGIGDPRGGLGSEPPIRFDRPDRGSNGHLVSPARERDPDAPLPRPPRTPMASATRTPVADDSDRARWPLYVVGACLVALVVWYASRDRGEGEEGRPAASNAPTASGSPTAPTRAVAAPPTTSGVSDEEDGASSSPRRTSKTPEPGGDDADVPPEVVVQPTLTVEERADMEWTQGYLLVESEIRDALVYVNGHRVGPVGRKNKIFCGRKFVRLGTENPPTTPWLTGGTTVELACRDLTVVSIAGPE